MRNKNTKKNNRRPLWIAVAVIVTALILGARWFVDQQRQGTSRPAVSSRPTVQSSAPVQTQPTEAALSTEPAKPLEPINLGYGVYLTQVDHYTGIYMEDGSDELVSDVMMIRLEHTGEDDIQMMDIEVAYPDAVYSFRATNLAAGSSTILLELDRSEKPGGNPLSAAAAEVVVFDVPMEVDNDTYQISGADGALNVKNISQWDIEEDIYVYYKYKMQDVYYGGITFRVTIKGGLAQGELRQIMTRHYNPSNCEIVMIEEVESYGTAD